MKETTKSVQSTGRMCSECYSLWRYILSLRDLGKVVASRAKFQCSNVRRVAIADAHLLVAQARIEADNIALKVGHQRSDWPLRRRPLTLNGLSRHTFRCMSVLGENHVRVDRMAAENFSKVKLRWRK